MPLHIGKGRTVSNAIASIIDYVKNPQKTDNGRLVSSYHCGTITADSDFLIARRNYLQATGRLRGKDDVIAYHLRQSFLPGEITPEEANQVGRELAMKLTKGNHAFVVCTHIDKHHVHNHIIFCSVDLDYKRKFRNFWNSTWAVRRMNDKICLEHGLSIVENPRPSRGSYGTWLGDDNIEVNSERRNFRLRVKGQTRYTRCNTLKGDYTEQAIRQRIEGVRVVDSRQKKRPVSPKVGLLIDIDAAIRAGKGPGYERWAKVFNLKQLSRAVLYLKEHGDMSYNELKERTSVLVMRFNELSAEIKDLESQMTDNAELQKQIVNYVKTRAVYVEYCKAGYSKKFRTEHEAYILIHQAAKQYFDKLGLNKLPRVKSLRAEYADLLARKRKAYSEYKRVREEMKELYNVKSNVAQLLNIEERDSNHEQEKTRR